MCKRVFQPTRGEQVPLMVRQAWKTMVTGRPGPVVLDVPFDIFKEDAAPGSARPARVERQHPSCRCGADLGQASRPPTCWSPPSGRRSSSARGCAMAAQQRNCCALRGAAGHPGRRLGERARRDRYASQAVARLWCRAAGSFRPTRQCARPTCCWRSACASTTAPRRRGSRAYSFTIPPTKLIRMSISTPTRSAATTRWRLG